VPRGRLKLRVFGSGPGELIQYERSDCKEPTESRYLCASTPEPAALREALSRALGVRAVVRKTRTVHLAGRTRIHLDRVEGLGDFIELEVVLAPGEAASRGIAVARELMALLEIEAEDLVEAAYVDLLEALGS
jgi:adenylate cyclase class IV